MLADLVEKVPAIHIVGAVGHRDGRRQRLAEERPLVHQIIHEKLQHEYLDWYPGTEPAWC